MPPNHAEKTQETVETIASQEQEPKAESLMDKGLQAIQSLETLGAKDAATKVENFLKTVNTTNGEDPDIEAFYKSIGMEVPTQSGPEIAQEIEKRANHEPLYPEYQTFSQPVHKLLTLTRKYADEANLQDAEQAQKTKAILTELWHAIDEDELHEHANANLNLAKIEKEDQEQIKAAIKSVAAIKPTPFSEFRKRFTDLPSSPDERKAYGETVKKYAIEQHDAFEAAIVAFDSALQIEQPESKSIRVSKWSATEHEQAIVEAQDKGKLNEKDMDLHDATRWNRMKKAGIWADR